MRVQGKRTTFFSIILALLPLLSYYVSPISGVDMGTFVLLVFSVFTLSRYFYVGETTPIYLYILLLSPLFTFILSERFTDATTILLRYAKLIVVLTCVFGFGYFKKYYCEQTAFAAMQYVIYACAAFVLVQRVFYLFGVVVNNPLMQFATYDLYVDGYSMGTSLFRPSAFFCEPSHLSVYGLVYLVYVLFRKDSFKQSLIVFVTLLCSGSGIGLVFGVLVYCAYFLIRFRKHAFKILVAMFIGAIAIAAMSRMTFFEKVVNRLITDNVAGGGNAVEARIGVGYEVFLEKNGLLQLFGAGYGNVPADIYLNGMTYILNTLGIVGCIIFLVLIIKYINKGEVWQKIGMTVVLGLMFGAQIFTPASLAFYFCVYYKMPEKGISQTQEGQHPRL